MSFKRKHLPLLRSLSTSGGDFGDPSQPSSSESVNGKSASPSRGSSESRRFVAASLLSAIVNIPQRAPSQQSSTEKDCKSANPNRDSSENSRFVAASLPSAIGNVNSGSDKFTEIVIKPQLRLPHFRWTSQITGRAFILKRCLQTSLHIFIRRSIYHTLWVHPISDRLIKEPRELLF